MSVPVRVPAPLAAVSPDASQAVLAGLITQRLAPRVEAIAHGEFPADFLHALGDLGGFATALTTEEGGLGLDLAAQVDVIAQVAETCGSTAFLVWCQAICAWYLHQSGNVAVRERYLPTVAQGRVLAGTGMSNAVKHLAGIERINLRARREPGGYRVDGALPWVSNLAPGHLLIAAAELDTGGYVLFVAPPGAPALTLRPCPAFSGMEGTSTLNVRLRAAQIPDDDVIAHPDQFEATLQRIKPAFLLTQAGMGLGLVQASIATITASNQRLAHVNRYLDDQAQSLQADLERLRTETARLARLDERGLLLDVLRLRAQASELALRATQSAALHTGAAGYLLNAPTQRRLHEALFVAIVTPALKHLRKEIDGLEHARAA